jgi:hypothetical protein
MMDATDGVRKRTCIDDDAGATGEAQSLPGAMMLVAPGPRLA